MQRIATEKPVQRDSLQKKIALEWLYLLAAIAIGLTVLPATVMLLGRGHALRFGLFYQAIANGTDYARWVALTPYILFQLVRSIRSALRAVML
jgi:hypothetical protein